MLHVYDPYVLRRSCEGRIFYVNAKMPFEYFMDCFQKEQPFFLVSQLDDGRIAVTPNAMFIPWNLHQIGYWPQDLLPSGFEYVTMKNGTYPVIISAHPLSNFEEWYRGFERCVEPFAKQTLADFVITSGEFLPVELRRETSYSAAERVTA